jgi:hypothetical protein
MNPRIPADYHELSAWLESFLRSHAKRENAHIEVRLETTGPREGRSYGARLSLGTDVYPAPGSPPIELDFREVAEGRTRFAWCLALAERVRAAARELAGTIRSAG